MPGQKHRTGPRIVAGVDGSPSSISALRWAVRQAGLTGAAVDAVIAWHYPVITGGYGAAPIGTATAFDFKENAEKVLADAISAALIRAAAFPVRGHAASRATQRRCCSMPPTAPTSWWWAAAGTADSPRHCSARSASTAFITRTAPLS